tara:strand:- start:2109 stop:2699 length:591 start_codon:yes stop_codon:yes gene_type:complete
MTENNEEILTKEIKEIIKDYIKEKYEEHLNNEKILLIKEKNIPTVIKNLYDNNIKSLKSLIRNKLKEKYKQTYSSAITEQIILEIFHDKDININKLIKEIEFIQTKNLKNIDLPIINNSLNLNISMVDNYIIINSIKQINEEYSVIYKELLNYKFIYSINDKILEEYDNNQKINIIKEEIKEKDTVNITLYYLKNN